MATDGTGMENTPRTLWIGPCPDTSGAARFAHEQTLEAGMLRVRNSRFDCVVVLPACGSECERLIEILQRDLPGTPVLVQLGGSSVPVAALLAHSGVTRVYGPDSSPVEILNDANIAGSEWRHGYSPEGRPAWRKAMIGESDAMQHIGDLVARVALRKSTVLITGESGTGKEVVAGALHAASGRANRPFIAVNCSALPEGLLESELFGHMKGAFTGAVQNRQGFFERANGGTIFLDEIGDMPVSLQSKLLRVLQEQQFERLGGSETVRVDVRVIAATNASLENAVAQGRFREDLFYRLNVVPIRLPPLRERSQDIPALASHFVEKICRPEALPVKMLTPPALSRLIRYRWPGNIRQLQNVIEQAVVTGNGGRQIFPADIEIPEFRQNVTPPEMGAINTTNGLDFDQTVRMFEKKLIDQVMQQTSGNKTRAAELLRLKRTTLSASCRRSLERLSVALPNPMGTNP
jgi:DNA-binding NtrC family response regulator